jgi:hypothetical protein
MGPVILNRTDHMTDSGSQPIEQAREYDHPIFCRLEMAPFAKMEGLVDRNAQDEV